MRTLASLLYTRHEVSGLEYRSDRNLRIEFGGAGLWSNIRTGSSGKSKMFHVDLILLLTYLGHI